MSRAEVKSSCDFATGNIQNQLKIDYLKRRLFQKVHLQEAHLESISNLKLFHEISECFVLIPKLPLRSWFSAVQGAQSPIIPKNKYTK